MKPVLHSNVGSGKKARKLPVGRTALYTMGIAPNGLENQKVKVSIPGRVQSNPIL
jgi:hypothetical protein